MATQMASRRVYPMVSRGVHPMTGMDVEDNAVVNNGVQ